MVTIGTLGWGNDSYDPEAAGIFEGSSHYDVHTNNWKN